MFEKIKKYWWVILFLPLGWLANRVLFPLNENQKIRQILQEAVDNFAVKDRKAFLAALSDDFATIPKGDRDAAEMQLKGFFFRVRDLAASIEYLKFADEKLEKTATETRVLLLVKVTGSIEGSKFQAFGQHGADAVILTMRKINEKWLIAKAQYLDTSDPLAAFRQID